MTIHHETSPLSKIGSGLYGEVEELSYMYARVSQVILTNLTCAVLLVLFLGAFIKEYNYALTWKD